MRRSALQSILDDIQRLVYSRGTVVMVCQLAQLKIPCTVCSPTAEYHRIPGDIRNWPGAPPCIQKRNAYSASLQFRREGPHSTQPERANQAMIIKQASNNKILFMQLASYKGMLTRKMKYRVA